MNKSALAALVEQQVARTMVTTVSRHVDQWAEQMVADILREPGVRDELVALLKAALAQALADLRAPADPT